MNIVVNGFRGGLMQTNLKIKGMTCGHCVSAVTEQLSSIPGVSKVDVDLESGQVAVISVEALAEELIVSAVDEAGYELVTIE